ncbi:hypothetical protein C2G38_2139467 [Gigaspora rosea]|uniref:Uncharacterized protein n=1 Tax=Gigaspora rosea TaxID=44941 RepID=A0A397VN99_9GLOM|nr:hypothetical protein C2G38_2139467 [Gigaspora rosea]
MACKNINFFVCNKPLDKFYFYVRASKNFHVRNIRRRYVSSETYVCQVQLEPSGCTTITYYDYIKDTRHYDNTINTKLLNISTGNQPNLTPDYFDINNNRSILRGQWIALEFSIVIMKYYDDPTIVGMLLSEVGGLHSLLVTVLVFLFGASKLSPWNCCQKYSLYIPIRRFTKMYFAEEYINKNKLKFKFGIPLSSSENSKENQEIYDLKNRLDDLENLLRNFYLDNDFLKSVENKRKKIIDEEKAENNVDDEENAENIVDDEENAKKKIMILNKNIICKYSKELIYKNLVIYTTICVYNYKY